MLYTEEDVADYLRENDVKFVCLSFCDALGVQKNISIMTSELHRAFTTGISFDASAIRGFCEIDESDLFLVPDPATMALLPWRPSHGRVVRFFCNICYPDSRPFELDSRLILQQAVNRARKMGIRSSFGAECEFYLFGLDENGNSTGTPADQAGYMDTSPYDRGENVRREICLTLEEMGLQPESSHHEEGPGQNEIDFKYSNAVSSADHVMTFKSVVETVASRNGYHASFRPKPILNAAGNGFHINMSARHLGEEAPDPKLKQAFMAGIMKYVREITIFLNPSRESYLRLGSFKAPGYVTWSNQNRSQLIRIPAGTGEYDRIELRSADCLSNPYLAYAILLHAGLDGIEQDLLPPPPTDRNLYQASAEEVRGIPQLPGSLEEAVELMETSEFVRRILPERVRQAYRDAEHL